MKKWILLFILLMLSGCGQKPTVPADTGDMTVYESTTAETAPPTGWQSIGGNRYYFSDSAAAHTGWLELPEGTYYFDSTGIMQTGWLEQGTTCRYLLPNGKMAVGTHYIDGNYCHFTATGEPFLLINLDYGLPYGYAPDLVELEGFQVARDCFGALQAMLEDCRAAGYDCQINSAYRDEAYQQILWNNRYEGYISQGYTPEDAQALTARYVLPPGHSEHHTGLAVDIAGTDGMYGWLAQHGPEYGFILRYPEGGTVWTGVTYEPWHFRYVGRELALRLQTLGFTPEEYLYHLTEASRCTG